MFILPPHSYSARSGLNPPHEVSTYCLAISLPDLCGNAKRVVGRVLTREFLEPQLRNVSGPLLLPNVAPPIFS